MLAPLYAAACVSDITILLTLIFLPEPPVRAPNRETRPRPLQELSLSRVLLSRSVLLILATALAVGFYMATLTRTFSLYADRVLLAGRSERVVVSTVGWIVTVLGLVAAFTQLVVLNRVVSRLGEQRTILLGSTLLLLVIASNSGQARLPNWWLNMRKSKQARIQVGGKRFCVSVREATEEERERLWSRIIAYRADHEAYQERTPSLLPVVILHPHECEDNTVQAAPLRRFNSMVE